MVWATRICALLRRGREFAMCRFSGNANGDALSALGCIVVHGKLID
jgi:hypothetical protein